MTARLLYQDIYKNIKKLIREGEYEVGDFLPPEGALEKQYHVSRTTIRKVVNMLVNDGYVEVKQGRGTKILDFHSTQKLNGVTSISETLRKKGLEVEIKSIYIDTVNATRRTAERLGLNGGDDIFRVQRVLLADRIPVVIMENYISCKLVPNLNVKTNEIKSLYHFLETEYELYIDCAKDIISAKSADFTESQILDTQAGAALLTLRRVTYSGGVPVTYDKSIIRADKYQFELEMSGRDRQ